MQLVLIGCCMGVGSFPSNGRKKSVHWQTLLLENLYTHTQEE